MNYGGVTVPREDGETSYYTVKCWRRLAENVHGSLRKGDMVFVRGRVVTRNWLDDQQRVRTEVVIEADSVGHDLAFGWSHFNRGLHTPPSVTAGLAQGEAIRQGMAPDPELPDDYPFIDDRAGAQDDPARPDDTDTEAEAAAAGQDDYALAGVASDMAQPADAAAPF